MKITVFNSLGLEKDQIERLEKLGEIVWLEPDKFDISDVQEVDAICGEEPIAKVIYELKDKFISFPFVGTGWLKLDKLAKNNVKIANAPGCNKDAVAEWIIAMMLNLSRKLPKYMNIEAIAESDFLEPISGVTGKNVTILGAGNIGAKVGKICEAFDMKVTYFKRGDNLQESVKNADFVVNTLSHNDSTTGILDNKFFESLKKGVYFISITDLPIFDVDSLLAGLDNGEVAGAAIDPAGIPIFDANQEIYKELLNHENLITTPHIAFHTNRTLRVANDMMIENVENWSKGSPTNIVN